MHPARLISLIVVCLLAFALQAEAGGRSRFRVDQGILLKDGVPLWAHGVNAPDIFNRLLDDPSNRDYEQTFALLKQKQIPFIRFWIAFYPVHWRLYKNDPEEFFRRMDLFVREAERQGIGLFPCLFWNPHAITDLLGERFEQWGQSGSQTNAFMRDFVRVMGKRYGNSPAMWGVEMANEPALGADLPNARDIYLKQGAIDDLGVRARTEKDFMTSKVLAAMKANFSAAAAEAFPGALISTGDGLPRESAWHNTNRGTFEPDLPQQFRTILRRDNPKEFPLVSLHCYPDNKKDFSRFAEAVKVAREQAQAVYWGEWGVPQGKPLSEWRDLLAAIKRDRIQITAVWQYGLQSQKDDWLITENNDRAFMLDDVSQLNREAPAFH